MADHAPSPERIDAVIDALERLDLSLAGEEADQSRRRALRLTTGYLRPRLADDDGRIVVAVVGTSGSGKSTLVNSIARRRITEAGTRRPTTVEPVAWGAGTLPHTLDALRRRLPGSMVETLRPPPGGLTIVDCPPPGVRAPSGEDFAELIVEVADVCVVVAGGHRYADAVGFDIAHRAAERDLPVIFVLNRLPPTPEMQQVLKADFAVKLTERGLLGDGETDAVIGIAEGPIAAGRDALPADWVTGLRKELERIAEQSESSAAISTATSATLHILEEMLAAVKSAALVAETRRAELEGPVLLRYDEEATALSRAVSTGEFAGAKGDGDVFADAIASAAARRAGRAALAAAGEWASLGMEVGSHLFTHSAEALDLARSRIEWWHREIVREAAEQGVRARPRKALRLVAAVRAAVLDPAHEAGRRERRLLRKAPGLIDSARDRLDDELQGILASDASRFLSALGAPVPPGAVSELRLSE